MLEGKHILVGISGGIAAYKIPELIRRLRQAGAEVKVTTTKNALQFVTELTLQTLSGNKVYHDVFAAINDHSTEHISLPDWSDAMIVAPATANVLDKMAHGIADDALTTTFAAMRKPVVIAPAMNDKMYASEAVQESLTQLSKRNNITVMDCAEGYLACGTTGKGRMQEIDCIAEALCYALTNHDMTNKHVLLTAGPTREAIDPVRYLTNHSSGKMGYSLARECWRRGAMVTLVSGHVSIPLPIPVLFGEKTRFTRMTVESAQQMYEAAMQALGEAHVIILCAAVADYRMTEVSTTKIKKTSDSPLLTLTLTENPDIAAAIGETKRPKQQLVGFALETDHAEEHAILKLKAKKLDWIVLNSLQDPGAGFGVDTNKVCLLSRKGTKKDIPLMSKENVAQAIISAIL